MVVYDLHIRCHAILPAKTDAPLVIDADAPLVVAIPGELLKAVAGRYTEEVEGCCGVQLLQLTLRRALHVLREFRRKTAVKQFFSFLAGE